jgi:hypothetical protein
MVSCKALAGRLRAGLDTPRAVLRAVAQGRSEVAADADERGAAAETRVRACVLAATGGPRRVVATVRAVHVRAVITEAVSERTVRVP